MNFAECTRESSSSDGWNADDSEDEENAKHIVGELKSNDRPTRKSRRIPPLCWVWKKRRRFRDGVKAAAIIISRFARFARRPSSVRSKLCAVIQSTFLRGKFCTFARASRRVEKKNGLAIILLRSSQKTKKNRESFHRAAKNALFFLVSLSFLCPFVKHPANDETTFSTPRDGACTQKNTLFRVSLRSKFFFFFQKSRTRKTTLFLSLSRLSALSLSRKRMMMMKTRTTRTTRRQSVREEGKEEEEGGGEEEEELVVKHQIALSLSFSFVLSLSFCFSAVRCT